MAIESRLFTKFVLPVGHTQAGAVESSDRLARDAITNMDHNTYILHVYTHTARPLVLRN